MDYKEKYEKALERAKQHPNAFVHDVIGDIFPELAESEDERIRKDILAYLKGDFGDGEKQLTPYTHEIPKWYAWLEKQGEQKKLDYPYVTGWRENRADNKPQVKHSVLMFTTHGIAEGEWLGEEWCQYRWSCKVKDTDVLYWVHLSDLETLEKENVEQKPVDDVKVLNREFWRGYKYGEEQRYGKCADCNIEEIPVEWSEEDENKRLSVIENLEDFYEYNHDRHSCEFTSMNSKNNILRDIQDNIDWLKSLKDRVLPQPKSEWSEEDLHNIERCITKIEIDKANWEKNGKAKTMVDADNELINWLKSLRPQPNQYLSEDDEGIIATALSNTYSDDIATKLLNKIKSLRPQKQKEWNWDDANILRDIDHILEVYKDKYHGTKPIEPIKEWLSSLNPQKQWKPSEEQIKALKEACDEHWDPDGLDPLYTLYEQLKAL